MSAIAPQAPPRVRPAAPGQPAGRATAARPTLHLAPPPREQHRAVFVTVLVLLLGGALTALLLLHTWAAQDGFVVSKLQQQQAQLAATRTALVEREQRLEAPERLIRAARALGMQPMAAPRFVTLPSGRVVARGAVAPPPPSPSAPGPVTHRAVAAASGGAANSGATRHNGRRNKGGSSHTASGGRSAHRPTRGTRHTNPVSGGHRPARHTRVHKAKAAG
jgi:hypothetical protein